MIDRLLRLERLDSYVTRAKEGGRRAVNRRIDVLRARLSDLAEEIEALRARELHKRKFELESKIKASEAQIRDLEDKIRSTEELSVKIKQKLDEILKIASEFKEINKAIAEKKERLKTLSSEEQKLLSSIKMLEKEMEGTKSGLRLSLKPLVNVDLVLESLEVASGFDDVKDLPQMLASMKGEVENQRVKREELTSHLRELSAEITSLKHLCLNLEKQTADLEEERKKEQLLAEEELEEERALLEEIENQRAKINLIEKPQEKDIEELKKETSRNLEELEDMEEALRMKIVEKRTQKRELEKELENTNELIKGGRCPTCKQKVTTEVMADVTSHLKEHIEALQEEITREEAHLKATKGEVSKLKGAKESIDLLISAMEQLKVKRQATSQLKLRIDGIREKITALIQDKKNQEEELSLKQEKYLKIEKQIKETEKDLKAKKDKLELLEESRELCHHFLRIKDQIKERLQTKKKTVDLISSLRDEIANLEERKREFETSLKQREKLEKKKGEALEHLRGLKEEIKALKSSHEGLLTLRGTVEGELKRLERMELDHDKTSKELKRMRQAGEEVEKITEVYKEVKKELRKRNIEALNKYFNDFFYLMDDGTYNQVIITDDYKIEVELRNNQRIAPTIMSGGERALINIALRCAIHQVLSAASGFMMPLILDEPTVYLDRERIHRLQFLLEALGESVGQVIVVSHEVGLVESADHEYRTEKGRDNISIISKVR
jgi:exonuclease SbcC